MCTTHTFIMPALLPINPSHISPVTTVTILYYSQYHQQSLTDPFFLSSHTSHKGATLRKIKCCFEGRQSGTTCILISCQAFSLQIPHILAHSHQSLVHHLCTCDAIIDLLIEHPCHSDPVTPVTRLKISQKKGFELRAVNLYTTPTTLIIQSLSFQLSHNSHS